SCPRVDCATTRWATSPARGAPPFLVFGSMDSMSTRAKSYAVFLVGCLAAALPGCADDGLGKRYPVSGKVTYKGQPVKKGVINFTPDGRGGKGATGEIVDGAHPGVTPLPPNDGILPGGYKVPVSALEEVDTSDEFSKAGGMADQVSGGKAQQKAKKLVPAK